MVGKGPGTHRKDYFFPAGRRIFETAEGKAGPTRWGVWVLYIPGPNQPTRVQTVSSARGGETQLRVKVRLLAEECEAAPPCHALIDTGAEVCIVRKNLIPQQFFQPAERPLRLVGANARKLEGGIRKRC
jgi:hypothetical protein